MIRNRMAILIGVAALVLSGCAAPKIKLFSDASFPLQEYTLQGTAKEKILLINIRGIISTQPQEKMLRTLPSMVEEIVSQLQLAGKDPDIKAVLLKIESPGGSTTASDILYHEIMAYKERTHVKITAAMMGVVASGGYYISLPADYILAHPTTITGSIGVILIQPKVFGLMEKVGLAVETNKFGANKDMGSPFRPATTDEKAIFQGITDGLGQRFLDLVAKHRHLEPHALANAATARVYLADEALQLRLVDGIGYLNDAIKQTQKLAGLSAEARVVTYRRSEYPDDNLYNTSTTQWDGNGKALFNLGLPETLTSLPTGFYYLWAPGM
jgi:protease-4